MGNTCSGVKKGISLIKYTNKGNALHNQGKYEEAIECYNEALLLFPNAFIINSNKGNSLRILGRNEEAIRACDNSIRNNQNYGTAYNDKGLALQNLGRNREALKAFDKAIEKNIFAAHLSINYCNKGNSLRRLGRNEEAVKAYSKAIEKNQNYGRAYNNKGLALQNLERNQKALKAFDKAIEKNKNAADLSINYCNKGNSLRILGKNEEAVKAYSKAIEKNQNYGTAYNNKGLALQNQGKNEKALEFFDKAIEKNKNATDLSINYCNKGDVLRKLGRNEEASEFFDKAIENNQNNGTAYNNKGLALQNQGKNEEALKAFDKAIEKNKNATDLSINYCNKGISLKRLGRNEEAVSAYSKAIEKNQNYGRAYNNKGNALNELGQNEEAIRSYNDALRLKPDDAVAYLGKGNALNELGKNEEAIRSYNEALRLKPDCAAAYNSKGFALSDQGKYEEGAECYNGALRLKPDHTGAYLGKGDALYNQGKNEEAVECYDEALRLKPDYPDAYKNKGSALNELGRNEEAIGCYNEALRLKPDDAVAYNNKGNALKAQGKHEEAIRNYNEAFRLKPDYAFAYNNKGIALKDQGKHEEAIRCYNEALRLKPDYADAYNNKGVALQNQGKNKEAIRSYNKALRLKPDYAEAYLGKGNALNELGKNEEAIRSYDKALRLKPDSAAYYNKGVALQNQGKNEEAIRSYNEALRLKPDFADAYKNNGLALGEQGKNEEALEFFDKAIEKNKNAAELANNYYNKGDVLRKLGRNEEASEFFDKAIEKNQNYALAYNDKGLALKNQGRNEEALEFFDKAIKKNQNYALAYNNKADALNKLGRYKEALECLDKVLNVLPEHSLALIYKARALNELERLKEAEECFKQVEELIKQGKYGVVVEECDKKLIDTAVKQERKFNENKVRDLQCFANLERFDEINVMLKKGEPVDVRTNELETFLHKLIKSDNTKCMWTVPSTIQFTELGKESYFKVKNAKDIEGKTILHYAMEKKQINIVEILLANGADPNIEDKEEYTILFYAIKNCGLENYERILKNCKDKINKEVPSNKTALEWAERLNKKSERAEETFNNDIYEYAEDISTVNFETSTTTSSNINTDENMSELNFIFNYNRGDYKRSLKYLENNNIGISEETRLKKIDCYQILGRFIEAREEIDYILSNYQNTEVQLQATLQKSQVFMRLKQYDEAIRSYRNLIDNNLIQDFQELFDKAKLIYFKCLYYSGNEFQQILKQINELKEEAWDVELLNIRGNIAKEEGATEEALEYYDRALEQEGWENHPVSLTNKGLILLSLDRKQEAIKYLSQAEEILNLGYNDNMLRQINLEVLEKSIKESLNKLATTFQHDTIQLKEGSITKVIESESNNSTEIIPYNNGEKKAELSEEQINIRMFEYVSDLGLKFSKLEKRQEQTVTKEELQEYKEQFITKSELREELCKKFDKTEAEKLRSYLENNVKKDIEVNSQEIQEILKTKMSSEEFAELKQNINDKIERYKSEIDNSLANKVEREDLEEILKFEKLNETEINNLKKNVKIFKDSLEEEPSIDELKEILINKVIDEINNTKSEISGSIEEIVNKEVLRNYMFASKMEDKEYIDKKTHIDNTPSLKEYFNTFFNIFNSYISAYQVLATEMLPRKESKKVKNLNILERVLPIPGPKEIIGGVSFLITSYRNRDISKKVENLVCLTNKINTNEFLEILAVNVTIIKEPEIIKYNSKETNKLKKWIDKVKNINDTILKKSCETPIQELAYNDAGEMLNYCANNKFIDYDQNNILEHLLVRVDNSQTQGGVTTKPETVSKNTTKIKYIPKQEENNIADNKEYSTILNDMQVQRISKDGDCLFNAIIIAISENEILLSRFKNNFEQSAHAIRNRIAEIIKNKEDSFAEQSFGEYTREEYAEAIKNNLWGGNHELQIIANKCEINIVIVEHLDNGEITVISPAADKNNNYSSIYLAYHDSHYDALIHCIENEEGNDNTFLDNTYEDLLVSNEPQQELNYVGEDSYIESEDQFEEQV